jgi:small basic protein (TIGR04137 family)
MSRHPSLKGGGIESGQRNVLKRYERVAMLLKKGEEVHPFNLPKYKRKRLKGIKKETAVTEEKTEGAEASEAS